jgi:hypothetical protein
VSAAGVKPGFVCSIHPESTHSIEDHQPLPQNQRINSGIILRMREHLIEQPFYDEYVLEWIVIRRKEKKYVHKM